jgi:ankyrin repeat protein
MKGHLPVVKLLLQQKYILVDYKDESGNTPLMVAKKGGHEAIVKLLEGMCYNRAKHR